MLQNVSYLHLPQHEVSWDEILQELQLMYENVKIYVSKSKVKDFKNYLQNYKLLTETTQWQ